MKYSSLLNMNRPVEQATIVLFFLRWVALPLYQQFSFWTLLNVAPLFAVGGFYLSFFFVISHNFDGVFMFGPKAEDKYDSFIHKQVANHLLVYYANIDCILSI